MYAENDDHCVTLFERIIEKNNVYMFKFFLSKYPSFLNTRESLQKWLCICLDKQVNENIPLLMLDLYCDKIGCNMIHTIHITNIPIVCYAAIRNKTCVVRWLLMHGADVNQCCTNGKSLLSILVECKQIALIQLLFEHYNVNVSENDESGSSIIFKVLENKLFNLSNYLLNEGIDTNSINSEGQSLLEVVVIKNLFLHTNFILRNGGGKSIYSDVKLFHKLVNIAIHNNSTLIANCLIINYFATYIQTKWRRFKSKSLNCT